MDKTEKKAKKSIAKKIVAKPAAKVSAKVSKTTKPVKATESKIAGKTLSITLVKSLTRTKPGHRKTIISLGLGRIGSNVTRPDNPAVRGMINKVGYLLLVK